jgi:hypothetical protein
MRTTFLGKEKPSSLQGEKKRQEKKRGKKFKERMLHQQQQKQRMDTYTHTPQKKATTHLKLYIPANKETK